MLFFYAHLKVIFKWAFFVVFFTKKNSKNTEVSLCIMPKIKKTKNFFEKTSKNGRFKSPPLRDKIPLEPWQLNKQEAEYISSGKSHSSESAKTS